jgi:hypothetical protein
MKDDKVDPSYFNLYFVEGNVFISTQLNPVRWYGYFEHYGDRGRLDRDSYGGPSEGNASRQ